MCWLLKKFHIFWGRALKSFSNCGSICHASKHCVRMGWKRKILYFWAQWKHNWNAMHYFVWSETKIFFTDFQFKGKFAIWNSGSVRQLLHLYVSWAASLSCLIGLFFSLEKAGLGLLGYLSLASELLGAVQKCIQKNRIWCCYLTALTHTVMSLRSRSVTVLL